MEAGTAYDQNVLNADSGESIRQLWDDTDDFNSYSVQPIQSTYGQTLGNGDDAGGTRHPNFRVVNGFFAKWRLRVEIYYGPTERHETPFTSVAGVSGFVTGEEGIGHVVMTTPDIAGTRAFYQDILGFRLSDIIRMSAGPGRSIDMEFYHCNPRHHTLALVPVAAPKRLHHFMLQVNTLDEVGFALERAEAAGATITATLGRHTNDHMVSFYARTPSGFEVEYGYGARTVDEATWRVARHDAPSSWGHKRGAAH